MPLDGRRPRNAAPGAQERGELVSSLAQQGITGAMLAGIIVAGRTRGQIADDLKFLMRGFKRAVP